MTQGELKQRTKSFSIDIFRLIDLIPNDSKSWDISRQITRSAFSVAANYRAVCRAKSDKDFISKIGTVIEEADETLFWLEIIEETQLIQPNNELYRLKQEANELVAIFVASRRTIKNRINNNS